MVCVIPEGSLRCIDVMQERKRSANGRRASLAVSSPISGPSPGRSGKPSPDRFSARESHPPPWPGAREQLNQPNPHPLQCLTPRHFCPPTILGTNIIMLPSLHYCPLSSLPAPH